MAARCLLIAAAAVLAGGCMIPFVLLPIRSGLTASVVGVVGKADVHEIAGEYFARRESFWTERGDRRGRMLHVRLSTGRDLMSLAYRKDLAMTIRWLFCDDDRQEVHLGENTAFVNGIAVWGLPMPSQAQHGTDRFVYDAILYVRDRRTEEGRRYGSVAYETFDLAQEPHDVCVQILLKTIPAGYRTTAARIPKEEIAAALGVEVARQCGSARPSTSGWRAGPCPTTQPRRICTSTIGLAPWSFFLPLKGALGLRRPAGIACWPDAASKADGR